MLFVFDEHSDDVDRKNYLRTYLGHYLYLMNVLIMLIENILRTTFSECPY